MKKVFRMSEDQLDRIMQTKQKDSSTELNADKNILVDESSDSQNTYKLYEVELDSSDIDVDLNCNILFGSNCTSSGTVTINGTEFDYYSADITKGIIKYNIEVQYSLRGVEDISLTPVSANIKGFVQLINENDSFEKEFEIEYDNTGLVKNTLSGDFNLGEYGTIKILPLQKQAKFSIIRDEKDYKVKVYPDFLDMAFSRNNNFVNIEFNY